MAFSATKDTVKVRGIFPSGPRERRRVIFRKRGRPGGGVRPLGFRGFGEEDESWYGTDHAYDPPIFYNDPATDLSPVIDSGGSELRYVKQYEEQQESAGGETSWFSQWANPISPNTGLNTGLLPTLTNILQAITPMATKAMEVFGKKSPSTATIPRTGGTYTPPSKPLIPGISNSTLMLAGAGAGALFFLRKKGGGGGNGRSRRRRRY